MSDAGLVNAVLAFIKAFRLREDRDGLVQSVTERFDAGSLAEAKKLLWDKCKSELEGADLSFHVPLMYCEANDLLKLPPLALDPVSEQLSENCKSLSKVDASVQELKNQLNSTRASLSRDLATVKGQISKLQHVPASALPATDLSATPTRQSHNSRIPVSHSSRSCSAEQSHSVWPGRETFAY